MIRTISSSAPLWQSVIGMPVSSICRRMSALRDQAIQRFQDRLNLPSGMSFKVISCEENENQSLKKQFDERKKKYPILFWAKYPVLQLYHGLRDMDSLKSIFNKGFYPGDALNKGRGVYLANHSRYSLMWSGTRLPVIICDVVGDPAHMKRHRSEVYSPMKSAAEYVVSDPKMIYPKYALKYKIEGESVKRLVQGDSIYVQYGQFGCKKCDSEQRGLIMGTRCDCALTPTIDPQDIVS